MKLDYLLFSSLEYIVYLIGRMLHIIGEDFICIVGYIGVTIVGRTDSRNIVEVRENGINLRYRI